MNLNYRLILASKSPRRQELLKALDLDFEIKIKSIDEVFPIDLDPFEVAEYLANLKSDAFDAISDDELVITSDTVVIHENKILGKASNHDEAFSMIKSLSGKTHHVVTGVCLRSKEKRVSFSETTEVTFKELSDEEINYYINQYQPFDKAGAYGIQEWIGMVGIQKIEGDYYNVMGLPLFRINGQLKSF